MPRKLTQRLGQTGSNSRQRFSRLRQRSIDLLMSASICGVATISANSSRPIWRPEVSTISCDATTTLSVYRAGR